MKPRTLARIAKRHIDSGKFIFDCPERKDEALRQIKALIKGEPEISNEDLNDPIVELHIGVYVPDFDYPIIPIDYQGNPIVWNKSENFVIPGNGSHIFRGVGLSGDYYYLGYLDSLSPFRDSIIKVDRYTDVDMAAYAMVCTMSRVIDKKKAQDFIVEDYPLLLEHDVLLKFWKSKEGSVEKPLKEFEKEQKALYIKWLYKWISVNGTNPETHMRVLRNPKKNDIKEVEPTN